MSLVGLELVTHTHTQVKRIASLEYGQWDELDELVASWADVANQALVCI
jgi:hypothetical protein